MAPATDRTTPPTRAELERIRAASRRRGGLALATFVLGLAALVWGRYRLLVLVAETRAAGRTATLLEMGSEDSLGFVLFAGGLLLAFGSTLVAALSFLHARHVERGLEALER